MGINWWVCKEVQMCNKFYLKSSIAISFSEIIDCAVGASGYGEDFVDRLNKFDKQYLKKKFRIVHPEEKHTKNHINYHTATINGTTILALEAQRILQSHA